jgi:hypothetical protein
MYLSTLKFDCEDATFWNFAHAPLSLTTCLVHIPCCIQSAGLDMAQELCQTSTGQMHLGLVFVGPRKWAMTAMEGRWSALSATFFLNRIIVRSWARRTDNSILVNLNWLLISVRHKLNYYWLLVTIDSLRFTLSKATIQDHAWYYHNPRIISVL